MKKKKQKKPTSDYQKSSGTDSFLQQGIAAFSLRLNINPRKAAKNKGKIKSFLKLQDVLMNHLQFSEGSIRDLKWVTSLKSHLQQTQRNTSIKLPQKLFWIGLLDVLCLCVSVRECVF